MNGRAQELFRKADLADALGHLARGSKLRREANAINSENRREITDWLHRTAKAHGMTVSQFKSYHDLFELQHPRPIA